MIFDSQVHPPISPLVVGSPSNRSPPPESPAAIVVPLAGNFDTVVGELDEQQAGNVVLASLGETAPTHGLDHEGNGVFF